MGELIDKEYARKCDCAGPEGRTWYVPPKSSVEP